MARAAFALQLQNIGQNFCRNNLVGGPHCEAKKIEPVAAALSSTADIDRHGMQVLWQETEVETNGNLMSFSGAVTLT